MSLLLWGLTIGTVGKLVLGIAVLRVHVYILREHTIDNVVLAALRRERYVTTLGLFLIALGYVLEMFFYTGTSTLLECEGASCVGALLRGFGQ